MQWDNYQLAVIWNDFATGKVLPGDLNIVLWKVIIKIWSLLGTAWLAICTRTPNITKKTQIWICINLIINFCSKCIKLYVDFSLKFCYIGIQWLDFNDLWLVRFVSTRRTFWYIIHLFRCNIDWDITFWNFSYTGSELF